MNWTPNDNYNGNVSGWDDGNPNGYSVDDAVIAPPASGRSMLGGVLRVVFAILFLAGFVALYFTARFSHSLTKPYHNTNHHRKELSR